MKTQWGLYENFYNSLDFFLFFGEADLKAPIPSQPVVELLLSPDLVLSHDLSLEQSVEKFCQELYR